MRNPFAPLFERRSLNAIGSSYGLAKYLLGQVRSTTGQVVNETTALSIAAVMTCVDIRSRALASLPVRVYQRLDERSKRPAVDNAVSDVLLKPNSWQTRFELFAMLETHRLLRGNGYAWINWVMDGTQRIPVELIPMHPDMVEVVDVDADGSFGKPTSYKLYRRNSGEAIPLSAGEVLHLKGLSTNGREGRSVLSDASEMLGGALATQEHANAFWSGHATPDVVLKHPKVLGKQGKENLENSFIGMYGGGKDKKRLAVLEEGMDITPLHINARDAQFLESRQFSRSEIAGWFHVPPHMIGDTEKSTSWGTGIEQQQIGFLVFTLRPDLVAWEQRLTRDLVTRPNKYFVEFSIEGFMRGDSAAQAAFFRVMREVGAMSANDIRGFLNLNPIPDGDTYLQPTNLAPLGSDPFAAKAGATAE